MHYKDPRQGRKLLWGAFAGAILLCQPMARGQDKESQPDFDRALNQCLATGRLRTECIQTMPDDLKQVLIQREAAQAELRRGQLEIRNSTEQTAKPQFGVKTE